jgi:hypothetical protein
MKRPRINPLPVVESMLALCSNDEVNFFFIRNGRGQSICVYPTSDDSFATTNAVVIPDSADPLVQASVIGLVRLHNLQFADQTRAAAATFVRACTADYYFGYGFGEEP